MIPISDIEAVIKTLSSKLPKISNGQDPNTYYAGRDTGERSAYSDAIRLLRTAVKKYKTKDNVNSN
jgi:hypothetical protein